MNILKLAFSLLISTSAFGQAKDLLKPDEFENVIGKGNGIILDVRKPEEFKDGHIKGAINANWQNLPEFTDKTAQLDKSKPVYIYCLAGVRSAKAADWLLKNGFKNVIGLDGGIKAWKDAGKALE